MEMSSSSASQWRPRVLMRTCSRCSGDAFRRRGNHASGTPRTRPSLRSTQKLSSSKRIRSGLTKVFIPEALNSIPVDSDNFNKPTKRACVVTIIVGYLDFWTKPELRLHVIFLHMDMDRFSGRSLVGVEEEAEAALSEDFWHWDECMPVS